MSGANLPDALTEMLLRFYGLGADRRFEQVWGVYSRRPYDRVLQSLMKLGQFEDITDVNDEVSFSYATKGWGVNLSMVGPYALVLQGPSAGPWLPVVASDDPVVGEGLNLIRNGGFQILDRSLLERPVSIWSEEVSVYSALFVNDERFPWDPATA